jgi:DNA-binding XRE family transcriptional regulator
MKQKVFSKKLNLNKTTIAHLEHEQMQKIKAGLEFTVPCDSLNTNYTRCKVCPITGLSRCKPCVC